MNARTLMLLGLLGSDAAGAATREEREFARAMAATPDVAHGATLFAHCTGCHGADGGGMTNGSVPRIAGQHRSVLIRQLVQFRGGKHWDMRMEGVATNAEILKRPEDIADVAAHASGLAAPADTGVGDGTNLERGAAIYQAECASCHGRNGEGDGKKETPRLAGQHAAYLARQIYDAVDARRPALSASHRKRLAPLTFEDVRGLTDYLSRLRAE